jgi:hypothetical protein
VTVRQWWYRSHSQTRIPRKEQDSHNINLKEHLLTSHVVSSNFHNITPIGTIEDFVVAEHSSVTISAAWFCQIKVKQPIANVSS